MARSYSLFLVCALLIAVQSRAVLGAPLDKDVDLRPKRSPDDWSDTLKSTLDKAKEGLSYVGGKISELDDNIKNSDAYEKVSSGFQDAGKKLSQVGSDIQGSDAYQGVKTSLNKAAENIKDKFND